MLKDSHTFTGYSVDSLEAAKEFYDQVLGLETASDQMGLQLKLTDQTIFIYEKHDHAAATFTVLNFIVDDIDVAVDELIEKGVAFERYSGMPASQDEKCILRGKAVGMGPDIAWFKDPAGNILSILSN